MQKNVALAILLSFGILLGWDALIMRPQRRRAAAMRPAESVSAPIAVDTSSAPQSSREKSRPIEKLVEYQIGRHKIAFDTYGAAVDQWWIQEKDDWFPLVPHTDSQERPFTTYPDREFRLTRRPGEIVFSGKTPEGLEIEKSFRLSPQAHTHTLTVTMKNPTAREVSASYALGWGPGVESGGETDPRDRRTSQRALAFEPPRFLKLKPGSHEGAPRWWGVDARYFLVAFFNDSGQNILINVDRSGKNFVVKKTSIVSLAPGAQDVQAFRFYVGPKGYAHLASLGEGLERSVDFGTFGGLGRLVLQSLYFFHRLAGNYGWAIILLTIVIQIMVLPLTVKSFRHSLRMKTLQPQMKRLQELYKGDPKRLNVEMLNLYQKHGLRFMGMEGCFPMLIQLPVFWALYTTLRNTFELRGAPWLGWVRDLSVHDPYYILPILMGAGMLAQQKMTMAAADPAQARMMLFMPVIFTFFFLKLPAGLVLYWFTNSLMSIAIQFVLIRKHK